MIDLLTLEASEAERIAYAEGFTMAAELFARIADLEAERDELFARIAVLEAEREALAKELEKAQDEAADTRRELERVRQSIRDLSEQHGTD